MQGIMQSLYLKQSNKEGGLCLITRLSQIISEVKREKSHLKVS